MCAVGLWVCSVCLWHGMVCLLSRACWGCPSQVSLVCRKKGLGTSQNLCFGLWAVMAALCHRDVLGGGTVPGVGTALTPFWPWDGDPRGQGASAFVPESLSGRIRTAGLCVQVFSMQGWWMMLENIPLCRGGCGQLLQAPGSSPSRVQGCS